jgi:hypothetical protein
MVTLDGINLARASYVREWVTLHDESAMMGYCDAMRGHQEGMGHHHTRKILGMERARWSHGPWPRGGASAPHPPAAPYSLSTPTIP